VGTPLGNLEDFSPRARRILSEVQVIVCEDTRRARKLLTAFGIPAPRLLAMPGHEEEHRITPALEALSQGNSVAIVTDAGMPVVSDPGAPLVRAAAAQGAKVEVIPGPSAVSSALALSGFGGGRFHFLGFLPRKQGERRELLSTALGWPGTLVFFEAPTRILTTLGDLQHLISDEDRELALCREMTKRYEEVVRGSVTAAIEHFQAQEARGEFTVVVAPGGERKEIWSTVRALEEVQRLKDQGIRLKEACRSVAKQSGLSARELYQASLEA